MDKFEKNVRRINCLPEQLPARLTSEEAAHVLGFQPYDIPVLIAAKQLKPLGKPAHNSVKYFARVEILRLSDDEQWLGKATAVVQQYWQNRNNAKKQCSRVEAVKVELAA